MIFFLSFFLSFWPNASGRNCLQKSFEMHEKETYLNFGFSSAGEETKREEVVGLETQPTVSLSLYRVHTARCFLSLRDTSSSQCLKG